MKGTDNLGSAVELFMDTTSFETGYKYYWKLPNGSVYEGSTLKIGRLSMRHRGSICGYYKTPDSCTSAIGCLEIKAEGIPCQLPQNNVNINSVTDLINRTLMPATSQNFFGGYYEIKTSDNVIFMRLNTAQMEEGEYIILPDYSFPSKNVRYAYLEVRRPFSKDVFHNYTNDVLYIIKTTNKYEVFVCNVNFENKIKPENGNLTLRLAVN